MKNSRLLREWVYANNTSASSTTTAAGKKSSTKFSGYKEKFEKIIDFHKDHLTNDVIKFEIKKLNDFSFYCVEQHKEQLTGKSYKKGIAVAISKNDLPDKAFCLMLIYIDGNITINEDVTGFENLLKLLGQHMALPIAPSKKYDELLDFSETTVAEDFHIYEGLWD